MLIFRAYNLQCPLLDSHLFPPHLMECSAIALSKSSVRKGIWYFQFPYKKRKRTWRVLGLFGIWSSSPSNHPRPHHAPIVIVIQSEHLKHSTSPRNQSAEHPDSGCFGISGVVIGSALSKGWRFVSRGSLFKTWPKPETAHEKPLAPRVCQEISDE